MFCRNKIARTDRTNAHKKLIYSSFLLNVAFCFRSVLHTKRAVLIFRIMDTELMLFGCFDSSVCSVFFFWEQKFNFIKLCTNVLLPFLLLLYFTIKPNTQAIACECTRRMTARRLCVYGRSGRQANYTLIHTNKYAHTHTRR